MATLMLISELLNLYSHCPEAVMLTSGRQMCETIKVDPMFDRHLNLTELCSGR